jgi:hypothetical protein
MLNKLLILSLLLGAINLGRSQTVFLETFTNADGTTTGTDDIGGVNWTATCTYCGTSGDWNEVQSNVLENADSNGPAYWETDEIDISACTEGVTISLDLSEVSDLEGPGVTCAGGCDAVDLVKLEVSYDGGSSWTPYSDAINGTASTADLACDCGTCGSPSTSYPVPWCGLVLSGPTIALDDFAAFTFSDCISVGVSSTVKVRTTTMSWAGAEKIRIDNVTLACSNCALPVEIGYFQAERTAETVEIDWTTFSESESKKFNIQRSSDGIVYTKIGSVNGSVNSNTNIDYQFSDRNPLEEDVVYYRLEQMDLNDKRKYSEILKVNYTPTDIFYDGLSINLNFLQAPNKNYTVNIYDLSGSLVFSESASSGMKIDWRESGMFILEIPELELRQKLVTQ